MKKIILFIFLLLPFKVLSLARSDIIFNNHGYVICDENNIAYPIYEIKYQYHVLFMVNYNSRFNLSFEDFQKVDYKNSPYSEDIQDYLGIMHLVNYNISYKYYYEFMTRYLWENIYPQKNFSFCKENSQLLEKKESEYQNVKERVDSILNGLDIFKSEQELVTGDEIIYQDDNLRFYYIYDKDGLEATLNKDTLKIKGTYGNYKLIFRVRQNSGIRDELFSDGENFLAMYPSQTTKNYVMNISIKPVILNIKIDNPNVKNLCLNAYHNDTLIANSCMDTNQIISFNLNKDNYEIKLEHDLDYEDFSVLVSPQENSDLTIVLKEKVTTEQINEEKVIYVNEAENYLPLETIAFTAKNTYQDSNAFGS